MSRVVGVSVDDLVDELRAGGATPGACLDAVRAVPRAAFIPARVWVQADSDGEYEPVDRDDDPARWRGAVYSDRSVVTQFDDGATEWPRVGVRPTCSASMPSVVVRMLVESGVRPGETVFEVGTGTGWNAALLAHLVGESGRVITVEIDPEVSTAARMRLDAAGFGSVQTTIGDAADGPPVEVDRVVVTAGVHLGRVPYSWVRRTRPGGTVLAPMRTDLASGPLVRFIVGDDGTASGRAVDMRVGFMELRSQRVASAPVGSLRYDDPAADLTHTDVAPWRPLLVDDHRWPIAVAVPSCRTTVWERDTDHPGVAWLVDPVSGSWASVVAAGGGRYAVRQSGPRRLWDAAETAYRWWQRHGKPPPTAWDWTIGPDRQTVTHPADAD